MAAEREPPPLGEARPADFEELEDGEDLFTSTVSTLEMHNLCIVRKRSVEKCCEGIANDVNLLLTRIVSMHFVHLCVMHCVSLESSVP